MSHIVNKVNNFHVLFICDYIFFSDGQTDRTKSKTSSCGTAGKSKAGDRRNYDLENEVVIDLRSRQQRNGLLELDYGTWPAVHY